MIKALSKQPDGKINIVFLGLSKENCKRLLLGQPIPVLLNELDPSLPNLAVVLIGGETEETISEELQSGFDAHQAEYQETERSGESGT